MRPTVVVGDARRVVRTATQRHDVIVSDNVRLARDLLDQLAALATAQP